MEIHDIVVIGAGPAGITAGIFAVRRSMKVVVLGDAMSLSTMEEASLVDDWPGMPGVMGPELIFRAVEKNKSQSHKARKPQVILLCPQGKRLTQKAARRLAKHKHLMLISGHYEGVDERVRQYLADEEISIGDYVLTGGELAAMVLVDAITRLIPGVLGDKNSLIFESFKDNLLEYPQYTRPSNFRGMKVPAVLLSGDHKKIEAWRKKEAVKRTKLRRPDLIKGKDL